MVVSTEKFLQYLEREKRYSVHTITAYKTDLIQFEQYLASQYGFNELLMAKATMIRSWLADSMQQGLSKSSINRKLSSLKSFYRFASRHNNAFLNPMEKVGSIKKNKVLPEYIEEEQLEKLLDQSAFDTGFAGNRDRFIIELLYTTGMRVSELCGLKHQDFDFEKKLLKITGKRAKQRLVPVIQEVAEHYLDYCRQMDLEFGLRPSEHIFVTNKGTKVYSKFVYRLVKNYLGLVTTRRKKSPHVLRHSFATHMLNNGADLNAIKEILGHANLSATQVYTHNSIEKIKKIYKLAHPKA